MPRLSLQKEIAKIASMHGLDPSDPLLLNLGKSELTSQYPIEDLLAEVPLRILSREMKHIFRQLLADESGNYEFLRAGRDVGKSENDPRIRRLIFMGRKPYERGNHRIYNLKVGEREIVYCFHGSVLGDNGLSYDYGHGIALQHQRLIPPDLHRLGLSADNLKLNQRVLGSLEGFVENELRDLAPMFSEANYNGAVAAIAYSLNERLRNAKY